MKKLVVLSCALFLFMGTQAQDQTYEAIKAEKTAYEVELKKIEGKIDSLAAKLKTYPGWKFGGLGTVGLNFSEFNNWFAAKNPNTEFITIGLTANGFANLDKAKQFWRNSLGLIFTTTKLDVNPNDNEEAAFETTADAITATSLYGYKLRDKLAVSALGELRSTSANLFDPGYLDLGIGGTLTPINDLFVVVHPLNYNFVFANDEVAYASSVGVKIAADYSRALPKGIAWKTDFTAFLSYKDFINLSTWTWVNNFSFTMFKGIGVGIDFGLRGNKQESLAAIRAKEEDLPITTFDTLADDDNKIQSYWLIGLSYSF